MIPSVRDSAVRSAESPPPTNCTVDEHQAAVSALDIAPRIRSIPLERAVDRVLAHDVLAPTDYPAFANSAVDGFAVRGSDLPASEPSSTVDLAVVGRTVAGRNTRVPRVGTRETVQIMTGAQVPPGADVVVPVEYTSGFVSDVSAGVVCVDSSGASKSNIRLQGSDYSVGDLVLRAHDRLTPARIGVLAALGIENVYVQPRLTVAVLSTGSELRRPGSTLMPGEIFESNAAMLIADLVRGPVDVVNVPVVRDDVDLCRAALDRCAATADLIVTTGGISAGTEEVVKLALAESDVAFVSVLVRPGRPQGAGYHRGTPVICLPGNPGSALVSYELFVRPVVMAASGESACHRRVQRVRSTSPSKTASDVLRVVLGTVECADHESGGPVSASIAAGHSLAALAAANCLIMVPSGAESYELDAWILD